MKTSHKPAVSGKTIARLSLYRRILYGLMADDERYVYSHRLAALAGGSAAQVRRDVMAVGYTGSTVKGYEVHHLARSIGNFLDAADGQSVALVGLGNLGSAILAYFTGRRPKLTIEAAFDIDPAKVNRVIRGCRCYPIDELESILKEHGIELGIITVPADRAQDVADKLVQAGVYGLVNFAPVRLRVPPHVYVEDIDMTMSLEKAAYFARQRAAAANQTKP